MGNKYNLTGKKVGKLLVKTQVPMDKKPSKWHGIYWYCDCDCGVKDIMVPTTYLTGNSNYTQVSCGCDRKVKAFLSSTRKDIDEAWINNFNDFDKLLFIHSMISHSAGTNLKDYALQDYKDIINKFYNDKQFNSVYYFWLQNKKLDNTFYDWAKPSLDHIVPRSRGGNNLKDNLQVLTVFENLSKRDMTWDEWQDFKQKTNTHSNYFIENIMSQRQGGKK